MTVNDGIMILQLCSRNNYSLLGPTRMPFRENCPSAPTFKCLRMTGPIFKCSTAWASERRLIPALIYSGFQDHLGSGRHRTGQYYWFEFSSRLAERTDDLS